MTSRLFFANTPIRCLLFCGFFVCFAIGPVAGTVAVNAQDAVDAPSEDSPYQPLWKDMKYRLVGPFRGGRSAAVTGIPGRPMEFLFGAAGGGVWKTDDAGSTWKNISDGSFGGSIGAIAVSASDPNVIYVGGGEKTVRGNVSHGGGVWKSIDGGATWKHLG
ncbi:MAG: hypothetical protein AAFN70_10355, partial [Planctomycetota bacterium]